MPSKPKSPEADDAPAFQRAAIKRIVEQLSGRPSSRRFLLADEVGLGKTHVAKGVIAKLRARHKRKRLFTVLYVCSNTEIARQNDTKLGEAERHEVDRLTLITRDLNRLLRCARSSRRPLLFSLTPATSFDVAGGYGTVAERTLLLQLCKAARGRVPGLRSYWFRGSVSQKRWEEFSGFRRSQRLRQIPRKLKSALAETSEWTLALNALRAERPHGKEPRFSGKQIGALRFALSKAILNCLAPDLIICDEFQRFSRLLIEPKHKNGKHRKPKRARARQVLDDILKSPGCPPILLLSATPYPFYTPDADAGTNLHHFEAFYRVLQFLKRKDEKDPWIRDLKNNFDTFAQQLRNVVEDDLKAVSAIRSTKEQIERKLRPVMCRTERAFFVRDGQDAVKPCISTTALPDLAEIRDFKRVSRVLRLPETGPAQLVDFWKSAPMCLAFTGAHYRFNKALRKRQNELHGALPTRQQIPRLVDQNAKLRSLTNQLLGKQPSRHLWCRPTYQYWRDELFGPTDAKKVLIFSHWKFVPTAVSAIISADVARSLRIRHDSETEHKPPIRFDSRGSLSVFDLCMPSPALAQLAPSISDAGRPGHVDFSLRDWMERCRRALHNHFQPGGRAEGSLWEAVAKFENRSRNKENTQRRKAWLAALTTCMKRTGDKMQRRAIKRYRNWLRGSSRDPDSPIRVSERQFERLVLILACSPALALMRAVDASVPKLDKDSDAALLRACLDGLRHQFSTRQATAIVKRATRKGSFVERALKYCGRAHFQAVMDEYVFLVAEQHAGDREARTKVLSSIHRALQLGVGSPQVRLKDRRRKVARKVAVPAHFAVAFGDDRIIEEATGRGAGSQRKTQVREAFNSPFWPFVLATTSVGQEGLDFHQYCRDVVHWNLPSNPVDLEQREGRVCRRNSLVVRQAIAQDYPRVVRDGSTSAWDWVFKLAAKETEEYQNHRGLCPHWIYEPSAANMRAKVPTVQRHVFYYEDSRDEAAYRRLSQDLALYRLAFGQPRQEDLIQSLRPKLAESADSGSRFLRQFMFDLTPFEKDYAWKDARDRARLELASGSHSEWCKKLGRQATVWMQRNSKRLRSVTGTSALSVGVAFESLIKYVEQASLRSSGRPEKLLIDVSATLLYVVNTFDDVLDVYGPTGLADDVDRITRAHAMLARGASLARKVPALSDSARRSYGSVDCG